MWKSFFLVVCLYSGSSYGSCLLKTENHIQRVMPKASQRHEIAELICKYSAYYGVDAQLIVAIAAQESSIRAVNRGILKHNKRGCYIEYTDYGPLQVNVHSVKAYKLDPVRIIHDLDYQINAGVLILAEKLDIFGDWPQYHSNTPHRREEYRKLVRRYL